MSVETPRPMTPTEKALCGWLRDVFAPGAARNGTAGHPFSEAERNVHGGAAGPPTIVRLVHDGAGHVLAELRREGRY